MQVQTINLKNVTLSIVGTMVALALMPLTVSADSTEVIIGDTSAGENQPGWLFNRDVRTSTAHEFNTDQASIGDGAVYAGPITNTNFSGTPGNNPDWDKFIAEYFPGTLYISDLNSLSYDFLIGSGGDASDENEFYLNVYANFGESDDDKFYDCRYNIVPTVGSTGSWTTVTFDPTMSYPVTTRTGGEASPYTCPAVPADMDTLSPGSNIRVFALNMGDTSANDTGLDGYFDNVVLDTDEDVTTFDFEAELPKPEKKSDCKKGGYKDYGFKNQGQCIKYVVKHDIKKDLKKEKEEIKDEIEEIFEDFGWLRGFFSNWRR